MHLKQRTSFSKGCLGSYNDEDRSEMRYVMRIARPRESSNCRTHIALQGFSLQNAYLSVSEPHSALCLQGWTLILPDHLRGMALLKQIASVVLCSARPAWILPRRSCYWYSNLQFRMVRQCWLRTFRLFWVENHWQVLKGWLVHELSLTVPS